MVIGTPTVLNLIPGGVMKVIRVNQVNENIEIQFRIMNGAQPFNVPEGVSCTIRGTKGDNFGYAADVAVTAGSNIVTVTLTEQLTAVAGAGNIFELVFVGASDDMKVSTENFILDVERAALGEDTVISDSNLAYANQVLDQLQSVGAVNAQVQQNKANIAAEITRATAAEQTLQQNINAEAAARQAADNTLQSNINAEASSRATTDASLQSQINQLVAPSGSAPSAAEVENARIGSDGTVYPTLGDAIRTQNSLLKSQLQDGVTAPYTNLSTWQNGYFTASGGISSTPRIITPLTAPILIKAYQSLLIDPNGLKCDVLLFNYNGSTYTRTGSESYTEKTTLAFPNDQYVGFQFQKVPQADISPSEFTGFIGIGTDWHGDISKNSADIVTIKANIDTIDGQIGDAVITKITGNNIYNNATDMMGVAKWYYVAANVDVISLEPTAASGYAAFKIPVDDTNSYVSGQLQTIYTTYGFYAYYFVDAEGNILSRGSVSGNDTMSGFTLSIPSGAEYLLVSMSSGTNFVERDGKMMFCYGQTVLPYEDYVEFFSINGFRLCNKSELTEAVGNLQSQIDAMSTPSLLRLPDKIDMIAGEGFELFYKGICNVLDSDAYDFEFTYTGTAISNSQAWKRKLTANPTAADVGTHSVTVVMRDNKGAEVDTGTFDLVVNAVPSSPASEKVILCVGDSLTSSGSWPKELRRRLIGEGGSPEGFELSNVTFIGTQETADGTKYEGYGGWTFTSYSTANSSAAYMWITCAHDKTGDDQHSIYKDTNNVQWKLETIDETRIKIIRVSASGTLPSTGTLTWVSGGTNHSDIVYTASEQAAGNPFWNSTLSRNDFKTYAAQFGVNHIDHCIILLGWNSTGTSESYYKGIASTFLDSLLDSTYGFPNCKITLVGLQIPSRNGMASNYGIGWKYYNKLQHVWNLQEWYQEMCETYTTADYVCLSGQFDTEYNCITAQQNVDLRNSTKVTVQTNAVHPAPAGYLEIADAVCRNLVGRLA